MVVDLFDHIQQQFSTEQMKQISGVGTRDPI